MLIQQHEQELAAHTKGIDYRKAVPRRPWPFHRFVNTFARLLGRKGGAAAFNAGDLETLKKLYNRCAALSEVMLQEAFERAAQKTIPYVAYEIQKLVGRKEH